MRQKFKKEERGSLVRSEILQKKTSLDDILFVSLDIKIKITVRGFVALE